MMVSEGQIVEGAVSRISGSGNAMLETDDGGEINLGPLNEEVVGERVSAVELSGPWWLCLEPAYVTEGYLEEMKSRSGDSINTEILPLLSGSSADTNDVGRTVQLQAGSQERISRYDGDKPIRVRRCGLLEHTASLGEIPVDIVAVRRGIAIGVPALESLESGEVEPGDVVKVNVETVVEDQDAALGTTDDGGLPTFSTDIVATPGSVARVGVLNVFNTHIDASPTALPSGNWPEEGEMIRVTLDQVVDDGNGYGFANGFPVLLPDAISALTEMQSFKTKIVDRTDEMLTVSVSRLGSSERPVVDDVIQVDVIYRSDEGTLCQSDEIPVWIPGSVPDPIESVKCSVSDVKLSHLVGSVASSPKAQQLYESDSFRVKLSHQVGTDGVGVVSGIPVVIPGGQHLVGEEISVGLIEARAGHLVAGVNTLSNVPEVGAEIVISEQEYLSRSGRLCFIESLPVLLPEGSDWPRGDIRIGVENVTPAGLSVSVASLPSTSRPKEGDVIELSLADLESNNRVLVDGIPIEIPPELQYLSGTIRLGVSGIQPNCIRCSIHGLPDGSIPEVGALVQLDVDHSSKGESRGRVAGVPALLPRTDQRGNTTAEVLVVEHSDEFLIAVDVESDRYGFSMESEVVINYYRSLIKAREAWEDDDFEVAIDRCRDAAAAIGEDSHAAKIFQLDSERHQLFLLGEQIRTHEGVREAQHEIQAKIETISLPNIPAATSMIEELKAYRFTLTGVSRDGSMSSGYLNAATRGMEEAKNTESSPWRSVIPHPLFATFLATVRKPRSPSAEKADKLVEQAPQYWPFLTLSEVAEAM